MDWVLDDRGDNLFTTEVEVEADRDYQYKFKIGHGNEWDLDEQSPTTSDNMGNRNNLMFIPSSSKPNVDPELVSAGDAHYSPQITPSEPARPVLSMNTRTDKTKASQSEEDRLGASGQNGVRDVEATVTQPQEHTPDLSTSVEVPRLITSAEEDEVPSTPLFAHESLGAYDFDVVDDGFDHSLSPSASRDTSLSSFAAFSTDTLAPDTDDPTLEKFPSDKSSVMDTIRRISTSTGEGPIPLEDRPSSPPLASRRTSVDSATDSIPSPGSLSPTSSRKRDSRSSHSSVGQTKSAVSLGSIIEEVPRESGKTLPETKTDEDDAIGLTSDEDGPQIRGSKVSPAYHDIGSRDSQASSSALSPKTPGKDLSVSRSSEKQVGWKKDDVNGPIEGRWFMTGGVILLAIGITWWKSYHN